MNDIHSVLINLLSNLVWFPVGIGAGLYWYPILAEFPVPDGGIRIEPIPPKTRTLILASDGYPVLKNSLEASEQELQRILEADPLLFRLYKATKGVQDGNVSYDDRAYIKLKLMHEDKEDAAKMDKSGNIMERRQRKKKSRKKKRS